MATLRAAADGYLDQRRGAKNPWWRCGPVLALIAGALFFAERRFVNVVHFFSVFSVFSVFQF